jgi:hypothetical protein
MCSMDAITPIQIERPDLLRLAADCDADPRTVQRVLRGEHVRGRAGERIRRVLEQRGLTPPPAEGQRA